MPKSDIRRPKASRPQGIGGFCTCDVGREGPGASRSLRASLFELEVLAFSKKVHMYGHLMGTSWAPVAALAFGEISLLLKFYFKYV